MSKVIMIAGIAVGTIVGVYIYANYIATNSTLK